jgi:hypothetical protein
MVSLTKQQTERIRNAIVEKGISNPDLEANLLDHICSAIETYMASGESFEKAYAAAMGRFGERELKRVQIKTQALLDGRTIFYPGMRQSLGLILFFFLLYFFGRFALVNPIMHYLSNFYQQNFITIESLLICGCSLLVITYARMELTENGFAKIDIIPVRPVPTSIFPIIAGILLVCGFWLEIITQWIPIPDFLMQRINSRLAHYTALPVFLFSVICFPLLSEILYRSIILKGMLKKYTPLKAIVLSSLLYACFWNPHYIVTTFLLGLFCGWLFYKTHSLLPSLAVQMTVGLLNFVGVLLLKPQTYDQLLWKHTFQNDTLYYGVGLVSLLLTVLLIWWLKKIFSHQPPEVLFSME